MAKKRIHRLNSLLKEVIAEVVAREVRDPRLGQLVTITNVEVSNDLHHARVFISVIGSQQDKDQTMEALQSAAGYIAAVASKKVTMRYFPVLNFKLDKALDRQMHIESLLGQIHREQEKRHPISDSDDE